MPHEFLGLDQGINLLNAHLFAGSTGRMLNAHAVFQMNAAPGFDGASVSQQRDFISGMMKAATAWIDRHEHERQRPGRETHWIWVMENDTKKRLHLHAHFRLSRRHFADFRDFIKNFRDLSGPVWGAPVWLTGGEDSPTEFQMAARRRYLIKGLKPDGLAPNGKPAFLPLRVLTQSGTVLGCRCRISNSLNRKARSAANWREITNLAELDERLPIRPGVNWWELRKDDDVEVDHV